MPGQAKIVSVITAPVSTAPNCSAMIVSSGTMLLRSACEAIAPVAETPRARAARTYNSFNSSSRLARVIRARIAASARPSEIAGRTRFAAVPRPDTGSHPSSTANTIASSGPSQKFGIETPAKAKSMRDRMEEHRRNPTCANCHKLMDPIGLSLENFDGIGRWRTVDNGAAIDASAQLADGSKIEGPAALRQALLRRPDMFARNVTEMLMTYALGHRVEYYDMPYVRAILKESSKSDYRFSSLVLGINKSPAFQRRRAES